MTKFKPGDIARVRDGPSPRPRYVRLMKHDGRAWTTEDLRGPRGRGRFVIVETALFEVVWTFTGYVDQPGRAI